MPSITSVASPAPIRILIADDHAGIRTGLRRTLTRMLDCTIVGEAGDGDAALHLAQTVPADVLLLDIEMPSQSGIEVAQTLHATKNPIPILVLSSHIRTDYILQLLAAGMAGYISKEAPPATLADAIQKAVTGKKGLLSADVRKQLAHLQDAFHPASVFLTPREATVLESLSLGFRDTETARRLAYPLPDIHTLEQRLRTRLNLPNRMALIKWWWQWGRP